MKNIVFIAPPASGKGTQSDLLVKKYGYNHISTGDLLREEAKKETELGIKIRELLKTGELVSSDIVNSLLTKALSEDDRPFILDGYPRNMEQIPFLDDILSKIKKQIDIVIYLNVPYDILVKRAIGRLSCPNCAHTFHKYFAKPKVEGICDECQSALVSRVDDTEETFKVRYSSYISNTKPLLDYYLNKGLLKVIDKIDTPEDTFKEIEGIIKKDSNDYYKN